MKCDNILAGRSHPCPTSYSQGCMFGDALSQHHLLGGENMAGPCPWDHLWPHQTNVVSDKTIPLVSTMNTQHANPSRFTIRLSAPSRIVGCASATMAASDTTSHGISSTGIALSSGSLQLRVPTATSGNPSATIVRPMTHPLSKSYTTWFGIGHAEMLRCWASLTQRCHCMPAWVTGILWASQL